MHVDHDYVMTLQEWYFTKDGELVQPFPPGTGDFAFFTIDGKTGDASGGPIVIEKGERIQVRLYNASQEEHSMHLHGHDEVVVSKNGHAVPHSGQPAMRRAPRKWPSPRTGRTSTTCPSVGASTILPLPTYMPTWWIVAGSPPASP